MQVKQRRAAVVAGSWQLLIWGLDKLTMVALVNVTAILVVGSLVVSHVNVRESALPATTFRHDAALHPKEVKASAPITSTAECFTLLRRSVSENFAVVPDNSPAGDLVV